MTHLRHFHLIILLGGLVAVQGCFNSESSPTSTSDDVAIEEAAIQSVIFEEEGELTDLDIRYFDDGTGPDAAPINTVRWRRELLDLSRTISIVINQPGDAPATAEVEVSAEATGLLHLLVSDGDVLRRLSKDFNDAGSRSMYFERTRVRDDAKRHRGWRLVAMSGMAIESAGTTRNINSVRVQARGLDETITSVSELVRVGNLAVIPPMTEVTVTVDTGDATDHVFLHRRVARHRMELKSNDDGTFTGTYMTGERLGARHVAIDVLSHGTLFEDDARYDNVVWGIPYRIMSTTDSSE